MRNALSQVLPICIAMGIMISSAADYSGIDWKNAYWEHTTEEKAEFAVTVTAKYKNGLVDTDAFLIRYAGEKITKNQDGTKTFRGSWGRGRSGRQFPGSVNIKDISDHGIVIRASLTYEAIQSMTSSLFLGMSRKQIANRMDFRFMLFLNGKNKMSNGKRIASSEASKAIRG